jgi:hypothetical protein
MVPGARPNRESFMQKIAQEFLNRLNTSITPDMSGGESVSANQSDFYTALRIFF